MKNFTKFYLLVLIMLIQTISFGQFTSDQIKKMKSAHFEVPSDKYIPLNNGKKEVSPAYTVKTDNFFTTQVNLDTVGNNIVGDAANEPSIAVDPTNPNRIIIGWRQFANISSNFRQAGYAYSTDGGKTWTNPGAINPTVFRSDPVLDADGDGNFYYNSLTADTINGEIKFNCKTYRILDKGVEWDEGVNSYGGDKLWMSVNKNTQIGGHNNYSFWSFYASACQGSFTRSTDNGENYEDCSYVLGNPVFGTLAIGTNGEVYVFGMGNDGFVVTKSTNAHDTNAVTSWSSPVTVDLKGHLIMQNQINPEGILGQAWIDVDVSNGPGRENVYVLASVQTSNDPADVMFAKSTDGGQTFSSPIRINTDTSTTNIQWFGTLSVAPNGRIDVIWLDTRDAPDNSKHLSALYYSYSMNQGETWSPNRKLSDSFDPHIGYPNQQKMGDYFDMVSDNTGAHLAWSNTLNGGEDVYYAYITPIVIDISENIYNKISINNYPNPFHNETIISFYLPEKEYVTIEIFDMMGKKVKTLLNSNLQSGKHNIKWNACNEKGNRLPNGFYLYKFNSESYSTTKKMLLLK
jgi:hypothetical protein